jgi:hypothetical protein
MVLFFGGSPNCTPRRLAFVTERKLLYLHTLDMASRFFRESVSSHSPVSSYSPTACRPHVSSYSPQQAPYSQGSGRGDGGDNGRGNGRGNHGINGGHDNRPKNCQPWLWQRGEWGSTAATLRRQGQQQGRGRGAMQWQQQCRELLNK